MQNSFPGALALVLRLEGGFVHDPADPGGATNLGVTRATLAAWRGRAVSVDEVRALTPADVEPLYRRRYWHCVRGDQLPPGLDHAVFDLAVNAGPRRAVILLQQAAGVQADGILGPITLGACLGQDAAGLVRRLSTLRLAFYRTLPGWPRFGRGWERRVSAVEASALAILAAEAPSMETASPPAKERRMTDIKAILASRTVWSNVVGLAALGLSAVGFDASSLDQPAFVDAGLQVIAGGGFIASTLFRIVATKRLIG
jgi:lysozyme family protein